MKEKNQKKKLIALTISFLLLLVTKASTTPQKFDKGFIEDFPLSTPTPTTINTNQKSQHTKIVNIEGTIIAEYRPHFWSSDGQVDFQIFFRKLPDSTYKDSLIIEFTVPYTRDKQYEDRRLLYTTETKKTRYLIKQKGIKIFELEKDFHILKGDEITEDVNLRTFETEIYVEKDVRVSQTKNGRSRSTRYSVYVDHFDLYFERGTTLHRMVIKAKTLESNKSLWVGLIALLCFNFFGLVLALQNLLAYYISDKLPQRAREKHQFVGTFVTAVFAPFYCLGVLKHMEGWFEIMILFLVIILMSLQNLSTFLHFGELIKQKKFRERTFAIAAFVAALNIGWIIVLFFQSWLILRSYFFYAGILLIDLVVVILKTYMQNTEIATCSVLAALRGFLIQLFFLNIYAYMFYQSHGVSPVVFKPFILVDFGLFLLLIVVSAFVAMNKGSKSRTYYMGEIMD